ncbi:MAG: helix-turn-helix transcriptional regulator [Lachnospiraceae bacterium]|nr:helix-turn-helix transcriptional regulator [Lachnospiraceae bacterium]
MSLERNIAEFIKKRGVKISVMSRETGIPYMALYDSVCNDKKERLLRGSELLAICKFLDVSPMEFAEEEGEINKKKASPK